MFGRVAKPRDGRPAFRIPAGERYFSHLQKKKSRLGLGHKQLPFRRVPGLFLGLEVDHSPEYCAEVTNDWIYASAPPVCLRGVDRDEFIFCNSSSNMRGVCLSFVRFCIRGLYRKKLRKLGSQ